MAQVKLGGGIVEIEGSIGGNIYWRVPHIQLVRAKTKHRDRKSDKQVKRRNAFSAAVRAWMTHAWTTAEIQAWRVWCQHHPRIGKKGNVFHITPYLAFMRLNLYRIMTGLAPSFVPPND